MKLGKIFKTILAIAAIGLACAHAAKGAPASWIWYPGDFDNRLAKKVQSNITYKGHLNPPGWPLFDAFPKAVFKKELKLAEPETIKIYAEGAFEVSLQHDGKTETFAAQQKIKLPKGESVLTITVENAEEAPSVFVVGKTVNSDKSWLVQADPNIAEFTFADSYGFEDFKTPPSKFALKTKPQKPTDTRKYDNTIFADFGRETFGFIKLKGVKGKGAITVYYGESETEAMADEHWEVISNLNLDFSEPTDFTLPDAQGFRYARAVFQDGISADGMEMMFEYADVPERGSFKSSDPLLNEIWDVSYYTLFLTLREYFVDGIKRDRWMWSGDAIQSYLMNYYTFFDSDSVKRTIWGLRGKDPMQKHINTIMDYTFYWLDSVYTYYMYSGDTQFLKAVYPRMKTLAEFCLGRLDGNGFASYVPGDWVFVDWAENFNTYGTLSTEQILLARGLEALAESAEILGEKEDAANYAEISKELLAKTKETFSDKNKGAFRHQILDDELKDQITRHANMFALLFGYVEGEDAAKIENHLKGSELQKITTPYMRFYELDALCRAGQYGFVLGQVKEYWGGMLNLGATSFWETFDPAETNNTHMYGRPFGRSFCHSWGATALYIIGRHIMGVRPLTPGYDTYEVAPHLGGLDWFEGKVPTPHGDISINVNKTKIEVQSPYGTGYLRFESKTEPNCKQGEFKKADGNLYELEIKPNIKYIVNYTAQ